jgi:hypothetical protein
LVVPPMLLVWSLRHQGRIKVEPGAVKMP